MVARTKRYFGDSDKKEFLEELGKCRTVCIKTCTKAPINDDAYKSAFKLMEEIDAIAERLTGNKRYFLSLP